jgi:hypothetical protein
MANTLLTTQELTFETLMILKNSLKFAANVYRGYDDQFAVKGRKIGATLNIRKPPRFVGRSGQNAVLEGVTDTFVPLVLGVPFGVDFEVSSSEMSLSIDDMRNRILQPAAATISNRIDFDGLKFAYQNTANLVGTPGTVPSTYLTYAQAGQKLDEMATPADGKRTLIINPAMRVNITDALKGLFNPQNQISEQYRTGMIAGEFAGFDRVYQDQNIVAHTIGAWAGSGVVNGAGQTGNSLITSTWTASVSSLVVGDVITLGLTSDAAPVYAVNPQNRQSTGALQQFVVTAPVTSDINGAMTIPIFPPILPTGQFQNVTNSPANGATVTVFGAASKVTPQGIGFHENAYALACVELEVPGGIDLGFSAKDKDTGIYLRFVRQYQALTDQWISRFDVLYGYAALYPENACRIAS